MTTGCHQYGPQDGQGQAALSAHLPTGMAWDAYRIPGKRAFRLWAALGRAFDDASAMICTLARELNPYATTQLLPEWERSVSLPDPCLPDALTLDDRRGWIVWRLSKRRWTTAQDWHDLAALYGLRIKITPGWLVQKPCLFPMRFPLRFDRYPKLGRFRVYIDVLDVDFGGFPYVFPLKFGQENPASPAFQCMIDRIRPANSIVIWNEFPNVGLRLFDPASFNQTFS